jgi:gas vesicle protein
MERERTMTTTAITGGSNRTNLMYLLIGSGIGATLALLFAPKSGSELRQDIGDATRKGYEGTLDLARQVKEQGSGVYTNVRGKADNVLGRASEKLGFGQGDGIHDDTIPAGLELAAGESEPKNEGGQNREENANPFGDLANRGGDRLH